MRTDGISSSDALRGGPSVGLWMDLDPMDGRVPAPGEVVVSVSRKDGTWKSAYRIRTVREVRRRAKSSRSRFAMRCARIRVEEVDHDSDGIWLMQWYSRPARSRR